MNKEKMIEYLLPTDREGMEDLIDYLEESNFFKAPASSGHHLHKEGGLAEHSYNVMSFATHIAHAILPEQEYKEMYDSIIIAALLHDVGKCGDFEKPMYVENVLKSGNVSDAKPYKRNPNLLSLDHATRSLCIIEKFIDLTEDEEYAIRFHDGLYEPNNYSLKGNETKLQMIIHYADFWCSHFVEER